MLVSIPLSNKSVNYASTYQYLRIINSWNRCISDCWRLCITDCCHLRITNFWNLFAWCWNSLFAIWWLDKHTFDLRIIIKCLTFEIIVKIIRTVITRINILKYTSIRKILRQITNKLVSKILTSLILIFTDRRSRSRLSAIRHCSKKLCHAISVEVHW